MSWKFGKRKDKEHLVYREEKLHRIDAWWKAFAGKTKALEA